MADYSNNTLKLPLQDLDTFPHFALKAEAADSWAQALPAGNALKSASDLRVALSALNRSVIAPAQRFLILEALRPVLNQTATTLTHAFLGQPLTLSEEGQQRAELVRDLYELGAAGYALCAVHTIARQSAVTETNPAKLACESLQRAVTLRGRELLRSHLLYQPPLAHSWSTLHQLYAMGERQQLVRLPVHDPLQDAETSIVGEYLPALLLGCCKTNQLRQRDIMAVSSALQQWRDLIRIEDPGIGSGLFTVDLDSDRPPVYSKLVIERPSTALRHINTDALVDQLQRLKQRHKKEGITSIALNRETRLDANLLNHLRRALGEVSQRNFARQRSRHLLWIATGLTGVHFYVAGERTLDQVLHGDDHIQSEETRHADNPFLKRLSKADAWQRVQPEEDAPEHTGAPRDDEEAGHQVEVDAHTLARINDEDATYAPRKHVVYTVESANVSPGGYCIEWNDLPAGTQIGDVVCLHERENGTEWSIAVIRWISQVKESPTLLGLELLSPRGTAYAAQVRMPDGEYSRPLRVILLPEIALVGQPHTLLVPRLVFRENQKIILARKDESYLIKLKRQVGSTAAFSQFDFDYLRQLDEDVDSSNRDALRASSFESIWSDI
ncbi:MAG: GTPase [Chromatocurvus sp.]